MRWVDSRNPKMGVPSLSFSPVLVMDASLCVRSLPAIEGVMVWIEEESNLYINSLEMRGVVLALTTFQKHLMGNHTVLMSSSLW